MWTPPQTEFYIKAEFFPANFFLREFFPRKFIRRYYAFSRFVRISMFSRLPIKSDRVLRLEKVIIPKMWAGNIFENPHRIFFPQFFFPPKIIHQSFEIFTYTVSAKVFPPKFFPPKFLVVNVNLWTANWIFPIFCMELRIYNEIKVTGRIFWKEKYGVNILGKKESKTPFLIYLKKPF